MPVLPLFLVGCASTGPTGEKGPEQTMAYVVQIDSAPPGIRIEANNTYIGQTPCKLKVFGDRYGTFHSFGNGEYLIRAFPQTTNQFLQTKTFLTGGTFSRADKIPERLYFDMSLENGSFATAVPPR